MNKCEKESSNFGNLRDERIICAFKKVRELLTEIDILAEGNEVECSLPYIPYI